MAVKRQQVHTNILAVILRYVQLTQVVRVSALRIQSMILSALVPLKPALKFHKELIQEPVYKPAFLFLILIG